MKTAAGRLRGNVATISVRASTPPAEAPMTRISCSGISPPYSRTDGMLLALHSLAPSHYRPEPCASVQSIIPSKFCFSTYRSITNIHTLWSTPGTCTTIQEAKVGAYKVQYHGEGHVVLYLYAPEQAHQN